MSRPPSGANAIPDETRVRHFVDVMEYCADQCADSQADRHDAFLWNARRAAEAILYALAEGTDLAAQVQNQGGDRKPLNHADFARKLVDAGRLHDVTARYLDIIRTTGNLGAHTQAPGIIADPTTMQGCAKAMCEALRWFFNISALKRPMPQHMLDALRALEAEKPRKSRARAMEETAHLLREEKRDLELERDSWRAEVERLRAAMARAEPDVPVGPPPRRVWRWVVPMVAILAAGVPVAAWFTSAGQTSAQHGPMPPPVTRPATAAQSVASPSAEVVVAALPTTLAVARNDVLPPPPSPSSAPSPQPDSPPPSAKAGPVFAAPASNGVPPLPCPKGTIDVEGGELSMSGARAADLARSKEVSTAAPMPIPRYCIDREPVKTGDFKLHPQGPKSGRCPVGVPGNLAIGADALAMNCVTWPEAAAYCASVGGHMPSILEWEYALRATRKLKSVPGTREWARDAVSGTDAGPKPGKSADCSEPASCPHFVLVKRLAGDAASSEPKGAWSQGTLKNAAARDLSFRCVREPEPR